MRSRTIRAVRQKELSAATFEAVVQYGLRGATLDKIAEIAGVSKGVVLHHFKDKSALLEAVVRRSDSLLKEAVIELYYYSETPHERLWAAIVANFSESIFNDRVCQAWVSLLSEVPHNQACRRLRFVSNARIESNFRHALKPFLDADDARHVARLINMLVDGIWMRRGTMIEEIGTKEALNEIENVLLKFLPPEAGNPADHKVAREKMELVARIALGSRAFANSLTST